MNPEYAVVIPAHNEAGNLPALIAEIEAALAEHVCEIIVVDDASTDETGAELARAADGRPRLRVLRHDRACGQSTAVWTGVHAARAPTIITLDGDGQNDPADIGKLIEASREASGAPLLVIGRRERRHDHWLRTLSSRVANGVRRRLLGDATPDSGCGLKLFERDAYLALPYFDHMHRFLPALFIRHGGAVVSVPVSHRARTAGESKYGLHNRLWTGIVDLIGVRWLMRRARLPGRVEETTEDRNP